MAVQKSSGKKKTATSKRTTSTKKNTRNSARTTKSTRSSQNSRGKKSNHITKKQAEIQRKQRRDMWTVGMFLVFVITAFSVFGMDGFILKPVGTFLKGFFGVGSYVIPFACLGISATLLFSKGEPVTGKIISISLLPIAFGCIEHIIFCNIAFKSHVISTLFSSGASLLSGGLLSGGIVLMLSAAISKVGSLLVVCIVFVGAVLYLCGVRMSHILDLILSSKDRLDERKSHRDDENEELIEDEDDFDEYDDDYEDEELPSETKRPSVDVKVSDSHTNGVENGINVATNESYDEYSAVRRRIDIPLSPMTKGDSAISNEQSREGGVLISEATPSTTRFGRFGSGEVDGEETIRIMPIRKKEPEFSDLPFDIEEEIAKTDTVTAEAEVKSETTETVEEVSPSPVASELKTAESAPEAQAAEGEGAVDVEVLDTHLEKEKTLGEKALKPVQKSAAYPFPPIDFLTDAVFHASEDATAELRSRSQKLSDTLTSFGIEAKIVNVTRGPSVTRYEMQLSEGIRISRLYSLQDDIALALGASSVRIAPIPANSAVGVEVPNKVVQTVYIRDVLTSREMANEKSKVAFAIGKDITGNCIVGDIGKMPHMLIAGTTGSGKSVCINSIIISILYRATPDEVKLIMIDPKMVELGNYNGIPHLLIPVVTDYKKAAGALNWAVVEMERRYKLLSEAGVKDLVSYNKYAVANGFDKLPQIVIIIDELADLMMTAAKEVEESVCRIAQKARAAGMHLIVATQRPSADVLTGLMRSNIPSRIAFTVSSQIDSRIILDSGGAEKLIGKGDMLYSPIGVSKPTRVQGCFLSGDEIENVVNFVIKKAGSVEYSQEIIDHIESRMQEEKGSKGEDVDDDMDDMFYDAVDVVMATQQASASMLQRKLKLGYARAARIIDQMETRGIIGGYEGSKPRSIVMSQTEWQEMKLRRFD